MNIFEFDGKKPVIAKDVFIAPNASIIGDVVIEEGCSIWYGAVVRGDFAPIRIGKNTSIQDNCVLHVGRSGIFIGENNSIGHGAILHNCIIGNKNNIGMNAVILDDAVIEDECMIAAGSVVTGRDRFPSRQIIAGTPAQTKKELSGNALWLVQDSSKEYLEIIKKYPSFYRYNAAD